MENFIFSLLCVGILLKDWGDKIVCDFNVKSREVTPKLVYNIIIEHEFVGDQKWWNIYLWKSHVPFKVNFLWWSTVNDQILVWEKLKERGFHVQDLMLPIQEIY